MSDGTEQSSEAVQPQNEPTQPSPVERTVPDGYALVSNDDLTKYRRYEEQARGAQGFYEKARSAGFERPEDFDRYGPVLSTLRDRGIEPSAFATMFGGGDNRVDDEPPVIDKDALKAELLNEFKTVYSKDKAFEEYKSGIKQEEKWIADALNDFDGLSEWDRKNLPLILERRFQDARDVYPDDHPLRNERLSPLSETKAREVIESLRQERAESLGAKLHERGNAKPTPTVGKTGGQGKVEDTEPQSDADRRRAAAEELFKKRQASRERAPTSTLGG